MSFRVCLDPGHGGPDPGALAPDGEWHESAVNLDVCQRIRRGLDRRNDIVTILTRSDDVRVSLAERVARANALSADVFLSVHCNASASAKARGAQVFVGQNAGPKTEKLAYRIAGGLGHFARLTFWGGLVLRDADHLRHSLFVLRRTAMPAVLVEIGFLTNPEDDARLNLETVRADIARGLEVALLNWHYGDAWPSERPQA
jgi:N-acetylmuramoyl-L-alanine amidase